MREYIKTKGLALLAASIALAALLAACSAGVPAEGPTATPMVSAVATSVQGTAAPTATERTPNLQFLPTAPPAPTARPAEAPLAAEDYYVVSKDGRMGVVNKTGKVVLPMTFANIDVMSMDGGAQVLFYATPSQPGKPAVLYTREGKKIALPGAVSDFWKLSTLIEVKKQTSPDEEEAAKRGEEYTGEDERGPYDYTPSIGAADLAGKLVIPCQYYDIYQFGTASAGLRRGEDPDTYFLDLFDGQGHAKDSVQVYNDSINEFRNIQEIEDFLIVQTADGKYGALNGSLQWTLSAQWDQINASNGQLFLRKDGLAGVADQTGKIIIPVQYDFDEASIYGYNDIYLLSDAEGPHFFDQSGTRLFYPKGYDLVKYSNGVVIAQVLTKDGEVDGSGNPLASRSDLYDGQGNFIQSIADGIDEYDPWLKLFTGARYVYHTDGTPLPLPDFETVECLSADRFIVEVGEEKRAYGLCDAKGRWLLPPVYRYLTSFGDGFIVYTVASGYNPYTETYEMDGLADTYGRLITGPVLYEFNFTGNDGLAQVRTATAEGLMDSHLNWIWYASDFEALMD